MSVHRLYEYCDDPASFGQGCPDRKIGLTEGCGAKFHGEATPSAAVLGQFICRARIVRRDEWCTPVDPGLAEWFKLCERQLRPLVSKNVVVSRVEHRSTVDLRLLK